MVEFGLLFIAVILFVFLAPFGLITSLVMLFVRDSRERFTKFTDYAYAIAHTIDILGNVVCADLFNIIMLKHNVEIYRFGMRGETISSAFGKNVVDNWKFKFCVLFNGALTIRYKQSYKLSKLGNILYNILDAIDPNHCIKSIQDNVK